MTHGGSTRGWLAAAALVAAALTGCSSGDEGRTETQDTTAPSQSPNTQPPSTQPPSTRAPSTQPTTTAATPSDPLAIEIRDYRFEPPTIEVAVGDTLTWTNLDDVRHTSTQDQDLWDSGPLEPGASFSRTFDAPGTYSYLCNIHNSMTAQVIVLDG